MNSRTPSWQCPLCNLPACNAEMRIDQNVAKAIVQNDFHENSGQFLTKTNALHAQSSTAAVAGSLSIGQPFNQGQCLIPNLNTRNEARIIRPEEGSRASSRDSVGRRDAAINQTSVVSVLGQALQAPSPIQCSTSRRTVSVSVSNSASGSSSSAANHPPKRSQTVISPPPGGSEDWRPSRRMRGSLSGEAYAAAFQQFVAEQRQRQQALNPRPPFNMPPTPSHAGSRDQSPPAESSKPSGS